MMSNFWDWIQSGAGRQVDRSFQHTWPLPAWLTLLLIAAMVAAVLYSYRGVARSETRGAGWLPWLPWLRIGALLGLLWMMVGGTWQRYDTELPELLVIVDDSISMNHIDETKDAGRSRFERTRQLLLADDARRLEQLNERFQVRIFLLADDLRELSSDPLDRLREAEIDQQAPRHRATRLGDGLAELLRRQRSRPTAAMVVITDGINTSGQSLESVGPEARRRSVPLYLVGVGNRNVRQDLAVSDLIHPTTVFPGDLMRIDAKLTVHGDMSSQEAVSVRLLAAGELVEQFEVPLSSSGNSSENGDDSSSNERQGSTGQATTFPLKLHYRAQESGTVPLSIQISPMPGESNVNNNRIDTEVLVRDETIRVLMAFGHPSFEFQFLKNLLGQGLRRDERRAAFELTTVLQDSDPEYAKQDADAVRVFPATRDELMEQDVIILGDLDPRAFSQTQLEAIHEFVSERGGALVVTSGPEYTPLAWQDTPIEPLLPIDLSTAEVPNPEVLLDTEIQTRLTLLGADAAHLQLTDRAADNAVAWGRMPALYWAVTAAPRTGVRTLVTSAAKPNSPLICSRFYGAGMVLFHATDESFRWSAHPDGKQFYARYWLQSLRYLARTKLGDSADVELTSDADRYSQGEPVGLRVQFEDGRTAPADDEGVLVVMESNGRRHQARLHRLNGRRGLFAGQVLDLPEGDFRAWLAAPTVEGELPSCEFRIAPPQTELTQLTVDFAAMTRAAEVSGGRAAMLRQWDETIKKLPAGRQLRVSPLPPDPIWNSWWIATIVVGLLIAEWIVRRREGL